MKRVLVTGSNGLLGQKLSDLYLGLTGYDFLATGAGPNRHPAGERLNYRSLDIRDAGAVHRMVAEFRPHTIIHTAAMTNVDQCESDHQGCLELNVTAVRTICEAANAVNAHLISLSTDFIFDGKNGPYREDDLPNPVSFYGYSKLEGEKIVQQVALKGSIVRTVLVYGIVSDMSRSNIVLWAKSALEKGQTLNVVTDQFRTPTLAEDLAMGCHLIEEKERLGIYHISGKDFMSIYELVERVARFWNLPTEHLSAADSNTINQPAKRPPVTGFILDKASRDLNYQPRSFEEGLVLMQQQMEWLKRGE